MKFLLITFFILFGCKWDEDRDQLPSDLEVEQSSSFPIDVKPDSKSSGSEVLSNTVPTQAGNKEGIYQLNHNNPDCSVENYDNLTPFEVRLCEFIESKKQ